MTLGKFPLLSWLNLSIYKRKDFRLEDVVKFSQVCFSVLYDSLKVNILLIHFSLFTYVKAWCWLSKQRQAAGRYDLQKNKINNPKLEASKIMCPLSILWGKMFAKMERKDVRRINESFWGAAERKTGERVVERGLSFCERVWKIVKFVEL